jgi:LmbE family N-acetylglucosaminyl deacetylase
MIELGCSGTILKEISWKDSRNRRFNKRRVGTSWFSEIRLREANATAKILGVRFVKILEMRDGFFCKIASVRIIKCYVNISPKLFYVTAVDDHYMIYIKGVN